MPYITGLTLFRGLSNSFNSMNLIWTKKNKSFGVLIKYSISCNHFMCLRNTQHTFCKVDIICNWVILFIKPTTHKLRVKFGITCSRKILCIYPITYNKHLYSRKDTGKFAFTNVSFNLVECFHIRMAFIF